MVSILPHDKKKEAEEPCVGVVGYRACGWAGARWEERRPREERKRACEYRSLAGDCGLHQAAGLG